MPLNSHLQVWICCLSYFHLILPNFFNIYCRVILCKLCRHFKPTLQLCSYCSHCLSCQYYFFIYKKTIKSFIFQLKDATQTWVNTAHICCLKQMWLYCIPHIKTVQSLLDTSPVKTGLVSHWYYNHKHAGDMHEKKLLKNCEKVAVRAQQQSDNV